MTVNERVIGALEGFGIPVSPGLYTGVAPVYVTFNFSTLPTDFGDDAPGHERVLVQVHLFCPWDYNSMALRRTMRSQLFNAEFSWPSMTDAGGDERTNAPTGAHFVFECEDAGGLEV